MKNNLSTIKTKKFSKILLCTILMGAISSLSIAAGSASQSGKKVSFEFNDIALKDVIQLVMLAQPRQIEGYDVVPNVEVSLSAEEVNSSYLEAYLLKCSGLKLLKKSEVYQIVTEEGISADNISQCVAKFDV